MVNEWNIWPLTQFRAAPWCTLHSFLSPHFFCWKKGAQTWCAGKKPKPGAKGKAKSRKEKKAKEETPEDKEAREEKEKMRKEASEAKKVPRASWPQLGCDIAFV